MNWVDWLYPIKCLGCGLKGKYFCLKCARTISSGGVVWEEVGDNLEEVVGLFAYKGVMKLGIKNLKYDFVSNLRKELSELISERLREELKRNEELAVFVKNKPVIVPVPLFWQRENWRGFNQAKIIGELIGKSLDLKTVEILRRYRATKPQVGLEKKARKKNIRQAFELVKEAEIPREVILVDDVWTTGSTMKECAQVLKKIGVIEVWGIVLAR